MLGKPAQIIIAAHIRSGEVEHKVMRLPSVLAVFLALYIALAGTPLLASPVTYTAPTKDEPGKLSGDIALSKIGPILLPDGLAQFSDDELVIGAVPDWLFDRDTVLRGAIVRAEFAPQQKISILAGLVYFYEGQWLSNLGSLRAVDVIETVSGEQIRGRIVGRVGQAFAVKPEAGPSRKVNFAEIKTISSPRAYTFNIPTATTRLVPTDTSLTIDAALIRLAPTALNAHLIASRKATLPRSTLPGADPGVSKGTIASFIALDIISYVAPAVSIPLVLNHSTQTAALNQIHRALVSQETTPPYIP